jgi:hypothetical protein
MILERKIPLITIKTIAMSNLRDDWMVSTKIALSQPMFTHDLLSSTVQVLNVNNLSEEGDPVLSCYFKTELASTLLQLTSASINLVIGPLYVVLRIPLSVCVLIFGQCGLRQEEREESSDQVREGRNSSKG